MKSSLAALLAFTCALAACDGGIVTVSPSTTTTPSPSESPLPSAEPSSLGSPSTSPTPVQELELELPDDAPTIVDDPTVLAEIAAGGFGSLAPPGAEVVNTSVLAAPGDPINQVALTWRRGDDPFASEQGFVAWQRAGPDQPWRAVHAFTDPPKDGVLGISLLSGELTDDGIADLLTFESTGGTGNCGTWRVVAPTAGAATQVFELQTCDTDILIRAHALEVREAVYQPDDPHCCPSAIRYTTLEWDGEAFVETDVREEPTT